MFFALSGLLDRKSAQNDYKTPPKWRPKRSQYTSKNDVEKSMRKVYQNELKMEPKSLPKTTKKRKNRSQIDPGTKRLLLEVQGLVLDVKTLIFGPPETHFRHFFFEQKRWYVALKWYVALESYGFHSSIFFVCHAKSLPETSQKPGTPAPTLSSKNIWRRSWRSQLQ